MKKHLTFAVVAVICASCSNEELLPKVDEMTGTPVQITAGVNEVTTRADETTTPLTEGSLGLFFSTEGDTDVRYNASNRKVTYNSTWNIEGEPLLWKNATTNVTYYAYYPYADIDEMYLRDNLIPVKVTTDQSQGISNEMDFLYADAVTTTGKDAGNKIDINFDHKMTKLTVSLTKGSELNDEEFASVSLNTYYGERPFNLSSGTWSEPRMYDGGTSVSMFKNNDTFEAIFIPQDQKDFSINITLANGRGFTYSNPNLTLEAGMAYTLNLIVGADVTALGEVKVSAWPQSSEILKETDNRADYGYTFANGTYTVYNETGLRAVNKMLASNITLAADITLTAPVEGGSNWTPIGTSGNPFTGTFDGNNHKIIGLTINTTDSYQGLIGALGEGGTVKNLTMVDCHIESTSGGLGGIVGQNANGKVENCHIKSADKGVAIVSKDAASVGGIIGSNYSVVSGCSVTNIDGGNITIKAVSGVGGIAGHTFTTIKDCRVAAYVNGGEINIASTSASLNWGGSGAGGIVGGSSSSNEPCSISGCSVISENGGTLSVNGEAMWSGGIVGSASGNTTVSGCLVENINVLGGEYTGGIAGFGEIDAPYCSTFISCLTKGVNLICSKAEAHIGGILGSARQGVGREVKLISCYAYQCTKESTSTPLEDGENITLAPYYAALTACYFAAKDAAVVTPVTSTLSGSQAIYTAGTPISWDDVDNGAMKQMNNAITNATLTDTEIEKYEWGGTMTNPTLIKQ